MPEDWGALPGARGCTPEACSFRDHREDLKELGAEVFGLSTQTTDYQRELVTGLYLPFEMLSDSELELARALRLPTFEIENPVASQPTTLIRRITLVLREGVIETVFYTVFPRTSVQPRQSPGSHTTPSHLTVPPSDSHSGKARGRLGQPKSPTL